MKRFKTLGIGILVLALAVLSFTGCQESSGGIAVDGTWTLHTSGATWESYERWTITDYSILYESSSDGNTYYTNYKADIVRYDNTGLNGGDTAVWTSGSTENPGHAIIRFTEVSGASWGTEGKYQVFRWATNESNASLRDFTQGYLDSDPGSDYVNTVFDTADAAEAGATIATGHFAYGSAGASKD